MKRTTLAASLPLLLFVIPAAGCRTWSTQHFVGAPDYEVARREAADGTIETFRLEGGDRLRVTTRRETMRPELGLRLAELDKPRAERRGVKPYSGLLVVGTEPEGAARSAGLRQDDVLLAVADREVVYLEQFVDTERQLEAGANVKVRLLRGDAEMELVMQPKLTRHEATDVEDVPLDETPTSPRAYAGVTLRGIPATWAERLYGEPRNGVVVSHVEVGSPAWLAGVRGGDLIETVDGAPVPPVAELARAIAAKGAIEQPMTWTVRREAGSTHEALVELQDYGGDGRFVVPILFDATNGTYEDRWRIGLGLVMGNRNHYVADQSTRRVQTRNVFSALLGLIKIDSAPDETCVRLLWFIRFET